MAKRKPYHGDSGEENEVYRVDAPIPVDPRYDQIATAMFKNQEYSPPKVKKVRVSSANPKNNYPLNNVTEEEYLKVLYPDIDLTTQDIHCYRGHKKAWFDDFMKRVFDKSNQLKYDHFMQRCAKTSPYNDNGGEKYSLLKKMVKHRSNSPKKNYQRNTIASLAKAL